ncbi:hypothetical protein OSC27_12735 [Microbacterium sp. STN6]|uniref:hypothetical protein n=1 Tax=Microbacterium sp. STN6 TaxID=2995588 RepID=UPI002260A600|nr:hypothetical protein [Microbacterium sp. STN6]MCX7523138.1 hypothetical protein [Microbacterium sp. STN6]
MTESIETQAPQAAGDGDGGAAPRRLSAWAWLGIGAASAVVGLLPWLVTGMRLPIQNLWNTDPLAAPAPLVLLPFSQYEITLIAALVVVGAAAAGIVARATRARQGRRSVVAILCGVLAVQLFALAQTATVVASGLQNRVESALYLVVIVVGIVLAIAVGALVLWLVARAPRAGALVGMSLVSVLVAPWLSGFISPINAIPGTGLAGVTWLVDLVRFVPAILVGAAIAWCGIGRIGRVIAAVVALLLLWTGPALLTGASAAVGSRVLGPRPADMVDFASRVIVLALTTPSVALPPILVAVAVAAIGLVVRREARRRRALADDRAATVR